MSESYKRLVSLELPGDRITLVQWVALIHPDNLPARARARGAHFDGSTDFYSCEYRLRCGDRQYRWFVRSRAS